MTVTEETTQTTTQVAATNSKQKCLQIGGNSNLQEELDCKYARRVPRKSRACVIRNRAELRKKQWTWQGYTMEFSNP